AAAAPPPKAVTFKQVAEDYITAHEKDWTNAKSRAQWKSTLATYAYPIVGDLPVADVTREHVTQVLAPIWHTKGETASRLRGRIELILTAAEVRGLRPEGSNPARLKPMQMILGEATKGGKHLAALPHGQIAEFMADLRGRSGTGARCLEFVILTATRVS